MNKFEIIYSHNDMPPDYRGYTIRYANDAKQAAKIVKKNKPYIRIQVVNEIPHTKET
jgi:hypothetical protein